MKISVIVPVYNCEEYLERCLDSLVNQTYKNIEIILVNDGSTDKSQEIIDNYKNKYSIIKSYKQKNSGQGKARNVGLSRASGELISFIDADDSIDLTMYEKMYNELVSKDADMVLCGYKYVYFDGTTKDESGFIKGTNDDLKNYVLSSPGPCNKLIRKSVLDRANFKFLEGYIYEDYATIPSLAIYCKNIVYLNESLYNYYMNENSTMHIINFDKVLNIIDASNHLYNIFASSKKLEDYSDELEYIFIKNVLHSTVLKLLDNGADRKYLDKCVDFCKDKFPKLLKNCYLRKEGIKFRIIIFLIFYKKYLVLKLCR